MLPRLAVMRALPQTLSAHAIRDNVCSGVFLCCSLSTVQRARYFVLYSCSTWCQNISSQGFDTCYLRSLSVCLAQFSSDSCSLCRPPLYRAPHPAMRAASSARWPAARPSRAATTRASTLCPSTASASPPMKYLRSLQHHPQDPCPHSRHRQHHCRCL